MPYYPEHIRSKGDEYYTPISVWENIIEFLPKDKIIYEPFYLDGKSGECLKNMGCKKVIHEDIDFWFPNIYIALNYFLCKLKH